MEDYRRKRILTHTHTHTHTHTLEIPSSADVPRSGSSTQRTATGNSRPHSEKSDIVPVILRLIT